MKVKVGKAFDYKHWHLAAAKRAKHSCFFLIVLYAIKLAPVAAIMLTFLWGCCIYVFEVLANQCTHAAQQIVYGTLFTVLVALFCVSFARTAFASMPSVPRRFEFAMEHGSSALVPDSGSISGDRHNEPHQAALMMCIEQRQLDIKTCDKHYNIAYCTRCSVIKPDRTRHCRRCDRCVARFDHHCPWVNACIGWHNHKYFLLTITYAACTSIFFVATMCQFVVNVVIDLANGAHVSSRRWEMTVLFACLLPATYVLCELVYCQVEQCCINETTVDQIKYCTLLLENEKLGNITRHHAMHGSLAAYSTGSKMDNCRLILGDRYSLWPLPAFTTKCDPFATVVCAESEMDRWTGSRSSSRLRHGHANNKVRQGGCCFGRIGAAAPVDSSGTQLAAMRRRRGRLRDSERERDWRRPHSQQATDSSDGETAASASIHHELVQSSERLCDSATQHTDSGDGTHEHQSTCTNRD